MIRASASAGIWLDDEWQANLTRRLGRAVAVSLALHLIVLAVVAWIRLPHPGERPLASIDISLVNPPTASVRTSEPRTVQQKSVEASKPSPPAKAVPAPKPGATPDSATLAPLPKFASSPVPKLTAVPAPTAPTPSPLVPVKPSNDVMRDVMKGIELPPDAPKFGDFSPTEKAKKPQLKLPDIPVVPDVKEPVPKAPDVKQHTLLTEDLNKELTEEFQKIKKIELPKSIQTEVPPTPLPQKEAKAPSVKAVETLLKVPGMAPGSNAYLARVRQRISSFWSAPPVDVTRQTYVVIVQFRLHRNGSVTGVMIERSSGNEYYDLAGKRAVLSAIPLPTFPVDLTEPYFDAHFTFTVGESQG